MQGLEIRDAGLDRWVCGTKGEATISVENIYIYIYIYIYGGECSPFLNSVRIPSYSS